MRSNRCIKAKHWKKEWSSIISIIHVPMFNASLHKTVLITILKEVYSDPELRTALGFKGGTAALLFYDLPRYSVDLDFDLLDENKKDIVLKKMPEILKKSGEVVESLEKHFTLFFLLNY